jgi:hypothetical protein
VDIAFVIANEQRYPDAQAIIASAHRLGLSLSWIGDDPLCFELAGAGSFIAMLLPMPHPDAAHMPAGVTSPSSDELAAATTHFVLTATGLAGEPRERDLTMAALTAAIVENTSAIGAMLAHGVIFHKAQLFAELAALGVEQGALPPELAVDITAARESDIRMSFLTHNLQRYGREELYVTCPVDGQGALDFVFSLVRWMLTDPDKQFPTGDTLGRTANERIPIQRVDNPTGEGPPVLLLELPG